MTGPYAPPAPAPSTPPRARGRGLIITGAVMLVVAIVGGIVGTGLLGAGAGFDGFEREVAIDGPSDRVVPGRIAFSVLEPLDEAAGDDMSVGIALSSIAAPEPDCSIVDGDGETIAMAAATINDRLLDLSQRYVDYTLVGTARLAPGEYEAVCETAGEPSASSGVSFTVGRVFGVADVSEFFGPLLGIVGLWVVAGLLFVVGVVLLIVGLVQRSRSQRPPVGGGPYPGAYVPGQYVPPGQYPPGQYVPPGQYPPGQYGAPTQSPPSQYPPSQWAPQQAPGQPPPAPEPPPAPSPPPPPQEGSVDGWTVPPSKN